MQDRIAELRERLEAQERWGKWNTAPAYNAAYQADDMARSLFASRTRNIAYRAFVGVAFVVGYGMVAHTLISMLTGN